MKNGLLSNYINDSEQDDKGYLWIATSNGCMRYSGNKFIAFQQQSRNIDFQIPSNNIIDLCKGENGDMFINTNNGLVKYDFKRNKIIVFKQKYIGWGKVLFNHKKQVFISTWRGIQQYKLLEDSLILEQDYKETSQNTIFNLKEINKYTWACAEDNETIYKINGKLEFISNLEKDNSKKQQLNTLCKLNKNQLLVGTESNGVLLFDIQRNTFSSLIENQQIGDAITCIEIYTLKKQDTFVLIGTANEGLFIYNLKTKEIFNIRSIHRQSNGILSNQINQILVDNNQGIWISTGNGLSFFHPSLQKKSNYFLGQDGFENLSINCVEPTDEDEFLVGTENRGLVLFNRKNNSKIEIKLSQTFLKINAILPLANNQYLIGTDGGVFQYNKNNQASALIKIDGLPMNLGVTQIRNLSSNLIGLCTFYGAWIYDKSSNETFFKETYIDKPSQNKRYCKDLLLIENNLWILRYFNGVEIYNLNSKKNQDITPKSLINKPIDYYNFTKNELKVFISSNTGIIEIDIQNPTINKIYQSKNGLEGNQISQVLFNKQKDKLYYSTYVGVFEYQFSKSESKPLFDYENYHPKWYNQFSLLGKDQLMTTVSNYFIVYNLNAEFHNAKLPSIALSSIFVDEKPYPKHLNNLNLKYFQNNVSIHFDALTYIEPEKNKWFYKIEGFSKDWLICKDGTINIYNISPGEYTIKVYAENNEGKKSAIKNVLTLNIRNAFYNTIWFYALIALFVLGLFYVFFKTRTRQNLKLQSVRNQISRDLHDDLGANVSAINIMSQLLNKRDSSNAVDREITTKISNYSIEVSDMINDIIWNINPKFDTTNELVKKMMQYATNILESAGITLMLELPTKTESIKIQSEVKYNLYLIFKEIVNNTAKHSKSKNAKIVFKISKQIFEFEIIDNGIGFNKEMETLKNGISNMQERAKVIDAVIKINSVINEGTKTQLIYKIK